MHYYKHDHHTSKRPEWWGIAAELGLRPLDVYAIWNLLHEHASQQHERGSVVHFRAADIAAQYGVEKAVVEAILSAFEERGMTASAFGRPGSGKSVLKIANAAVGKSDHQYSAEDLLHAVERKLIPDILAGGDALIDCVM